MSTDSSKLNPRLLETDNIQRCDLKNCQAACCYDGVWVDEAHVKKIMNNAELISPYLNQENRISETWFDDKTEDDPYTPSRRVIHSTVITDKNHYQGTACIFLREDYKCALQVTSQKSGFHPWHFKPFYCVLHPLDIDEDGKFTLDSSLEMVDEPASCVRTSNKKNSLLDVFSDELNYLIGNI